MFASRVAVVALAASAVVPALSGPLAFSGVLALHDSALASHDHGPSGSEIREFLSHSKTRRESDPNSSPMDTLEKFFSANSQWASSVNTSAPGFFEQSAKGQTPKVLWIGCSDSRVPESLITGSGPGDLFVHRNIANQFHAEDDNAHAVISYAVEHLHVEHIFVVGHTHCGGCAAALKSAIGPPIAFEPVLQRWLTPLISIASGLNLAAEPHDAAVTKVAEKNVCMQVENVVNSEPVHKAWGEGGRKNLWVHGLMYELETGKLRDLGITKGAPA